MGADQDLGDFLRAIYLPTHLGVGQAHVVSALVTIRVYSRWLGRPAGLADLAPDPIRRFAVDYLRAGARPATVNQKLRYLLAFWRSAWAEGLIDTSPDHLRRRIGKLPEEISQPEAWSIAEVGRVLRAAGSLQGTVAGLPAATYWVSLCLTLYDSGERPGCIFRLPISDLDFGRGGILVRRRKTHQDRWYALAPDTLEQLAVIFDPGRELVWPWPYSREFRYKFFKREIAWRARVRAGRDQGGVFYKFRRTSGSLIEAAGGDGAKHLGHGRAIFERHYWDRRFSHSQLDLLPRPQF